MPRRTHTIRNRHLSPLSATAVAASVLGALLLAPTADAQVGSLTTAPAPACTKIAGPAEAQPAAFRAFVGGLLPGEVGCLPAGTYGGLNERFAMPLKHAGPRITLRALDYSKRPTVIGQLLLTGDVITVSGLIFDGPAGCDSPPPEPCAQMAPLVVNGNNVEVNRSEIKDSASHEGIHVGNQIGAAPPVNVRLLRNNVHDNGVRTDPTRSNLDHGINWVQGSGVIANSVIANNHAYGVHLAPYAKNVRVTFNTIVGHGRNGVIIGDCDPAENGHVGFACSTPRGLDFATGNVVDNNIVANNCKSLAAFYCSGGVGAFLLDSKTNGNVVRNNLFFHNFALRSRSCDGRRRCRPRSPRGLNYTYANPRFVGGPQSKGSQRYALRARSPAIGRGSAQAKGEDFNGKPRPSPKRTRPDRGAIEHTRLPH